ncbi:MAG: hypothetical protein ABF665_11180 [Gluconacetobacter sp.]
MSGVKGKRIVWTIEMRAKAVEMRIAGESLCAIGRALGVSHAAVRSMLERELTTPFDRARNQALRRAYSPRGSVMKGFEI